MKFIFKTVVTLGIFAFLFIFVDIQKVLAEIVSANLLFLFIAVLAQFLSTLLASYRWNIIMQILGFKERFYFYFRSYFKGSFFNQLLPSNIGGDAVRVLDLTSFGYSLKLSIFGIIIDRVFGILALLFLGLIAGFFAKDMIPKGLYETINIIFVLGILGVVVLTFYNRVRPLLNLKITSYIRDISASFNAVFSNYKLFSIQFLYSIFVHIFSIFSIFFIAKAVGIDKEASLFLTLIPIVILLMAIPISLAGWGIREGAMVGLFSLVGVNKELILSVSLIYGFVVIITIVPGFFYWLKDKKRFV